METFSPDFTLIFGSVCFALFAFGITVAKAIYDVGHSAGYTKGFREGRKPTVTTTFTEDFEP